MSDYIYTTCKTACNRVKGGFPYLWDLNVYRGCGHGCRYCFALYSHDYLEMGSGNKFFRQIYVKTNVAEMLEKQLASPKWKGEVINLGGVTDSYQPAEAENRLMPEIFKILIKYRNPCIVSTKSDLILRDFDLIEELAELTYVNVASTITCANPDLAAKIEPGAATPKKRFAMLKEFSKTKASIGVHDMPIIPYLTDTRENLEALYSGARDCGADYLLPQFLNLRGRTREEFFNFIWREFPHLVAPLNDLYNDYPARKIYKGEIYKIIREMSGKYGLNADYMGPMRKRYSPETGRKTAQKEKPEEGEQLRFF